MKYTYDTYVCGVFAIIVTIIIFGKIKNIFRIAGLYLIICFIDMLIAGCVIICYSVDAMLLIENYAYTLLLNGVGIVLFKSISLLQRHINLNFNMEHISWKDALLVITCIIGGGFYIAPFYFFSNDFGRLFAVGANISGIIIGVFSILLILRSNSIRQLKREQMLQEGVITAQQKYYSKRLEQEKNTRKFRHDINEHMSMISYYVSKDMHDEAKGYLQQLTNDLKDISEQSGINTGLDIVNIILADLASIYPDTQIQWIGTVPQDIAIANKDLIGLFSNLLKNAFEAAAKCIISSYVDVCTSYYDGQMYISVKNSCNGKAQRNGKSFLTSKKIRKNMDLAHRL